MEPLYDAQHQHDAIAAGILGRERRGHKVLCSKAHVVREARGVRGHRVRHVPGAEHGARGEVVELAVRAQPRPAERQVRLGLVDQRAVRVDARDGARRKVERWRKGGSAMRAGPREEGEGSTDVDADLAGVAADIEHGAVSEERG